MFITATTVERKVYPLVYCQSMKGIVLLILIVIADFVITILILVHLLLI